eukprot:10405811-Ditylum_brightwellii.AAC.1
MICHDGERVGKLIHRTKRTRATLVLTSTDKVDSSFDTNDFDEDDLFDEIDLNVVGDIAANENHVKKEETTEKIAVEDNDNAAAETNEAGDSFDFDNGEGDGWDMDDYMLNDLSKPSQQTTVENIKEANPQTPPSNIDEEWLQPYPHTSGQSNTTE